MQSLDFNFQQEPFDRTIQLYGDRAGGQGNFDFAGLAKIQTMKFVLLIGNPQSLEQPADWRRFLRMLHLAKRLQKPVLLWNLPHTQNTSVEIRTTLEMGTEIKKTKLQLLKLPQPIISVYDDTIELDGTIQGMSWGDETIVVLSNEETVQREKTVNNNNLHFVSNTSDFKEMISDILDEYSGKKASQLVEKRLERY